ncbi:MAG: cysteine desulfurase [Bacilli bacterium]
MNFKQDFPMLSKTTYFDSCATTLKPRCVIEKMTDYYENYCANAHRGDYDISKKVDAEFEETRDKTAKFINAFSSKEIIFTSGATESLNLAISGFFTSYLKPGDEIVTTKAEHASLILPWFEVAKKTGAIIKYVDLESDLIVTFNNVKKAVTSKTKVISLAHITNVIGDVRPIKEISSFAHKQGILMVVDGAQSVPHKKVDVNDLDVDFYAFSAHKMLGPTGVGVLYGKEKYLEKVKPLNVGGGMNAFFDSKMNTEYKELPYKLEAGTPNIAGVIGFSKAIDYINELGIENIYSYEVSLKKYMVEKLEKLKNVVIYNKNIKNGIITFNVDGVFSQDVAAYLNKKNICVRVGNHCAKTLSEVLGVSNTCRVSLYFYNTKEDVDKLIDALDNENILYDSL